jgi:hypothetical protein
MDVLVASDDLEFGVLAEFGGVLRSSIYLGRAAELTEAGGFDDGNAVES